MAVLSTFVTACAEGETASLDVHEDITEELSDPSGESIVGETLATIMCVDPNQPTEHGVKLTIGDWITYSNPGWTPHAPQCDERHIGRQLRLYVRDQKFVQNPMGKWVFIQSEEEGLLRGPNGGKARAFLDALDTLGKPEQITLSAVELALEITTWGGSRVHDGEWKHDNVGEEIRGTYRVTLEDGSAQEGVIEGVWCDGSAHCEED